MSEFFTPEAAHSPVVCVLVADGGRARFFNTVTGTPQLREDQALENPIARLHEHDLHSDRAGHLTQVADHGSHSGGNSAGQSQSTREHADAIFATTVAEELKRRRLSGGYARFHVVSAPGFLGLLRKALDRPTLAMIATQTAKDISRGTADEIRALLPPHL